MKASWFKRQDYKPVDRVGIQVLLWKPCASDARVPRWARHAAEQLGERVRLERYDTLEPEVFDEWSIADALFVDGRAVRTGPPPSYEDLRRLIERRLRKPA